MVLDTRVIGTNKTRTCVRLKWDPGRESNAALGKAHVLLLHKRQQFARGLEVWRAAMGGRAAESALWSTPTDAITEIGHLVLQHQQQNRTSQRRQRDPHVPDR